MNTDTHTSGSTVKNHISFQTVFEYSVIRKTSYQSWFPVYQRVLSQACLLQHPMTPLRQEIGHPKSSSSSSISTPMTSSTEIDHSDHPPTTVSSGSVDRQEWRDPYGMDHHPAIVSSEIVERQVWRDLYSSEISEELLNKPTQIPKPNKNENHEQVREDPYYSEKLEWLQEFRENLVDDRVPERRDSHASSSHEISLEPTRSADSGKPSVHTHFPKDRNCEICQRTKITRAPCRRRIGGAVPRAKKW